MIKIRPYERGDADEKIDEAESEEWDTKYLEVDAKKWMSQENFESKTRQSDRKTSSWRHFYFFIDEEWFQSN